MTARTTWTASAMPAVTIPTAVGGKIAAELRSRFLDTGYTRYALLDRGSYDCVATPPITDLAPVLEGISSEVTGRTLTVASARVLRLLPGDYLLVRHDRVHDDGPVELVLDLSPMAVQNAEVHWRHRGQVFFTMPSTPGAMSLVERGPTVMSNHTYVTKRWTGTAVVRLVVILRGPR